MAEVTVKPAPVVATADEVDDFKVAPARREPHVRKDGTAPAPVPALGATALISRGARASDRLPVFYTEGVEARQQYVMPLCAVSALIAAELVSPAEYVALLSPAQRAEVAKLLAK